MEVINQGKSPRERSIHPSLITLSGFFPHEKLEKPQHLRKDQIEGTSLPRLGIILGLGSKGNGGFGDLGFG